MIGFFSLPWLGDSDVSGLQMAQEEARYCCCQWHIEAREVPCSDYKCLCGVDFAELH